MEMENFFVADSYKNNEIIGEPYMNEKGKMYVKTIGVCPRCGGSGSYSYNPLDGTKCYGCNGAGKVIQKVRAYTEKEYKSMQRANVRSRQRREEQKAAKEKDLIENAAQYKHEVALKLGFGEDEKIYAVYGDDTYAIKDKLKEMGARFDFTIKKWYFSNRVENLPEGYSLCEFSFDELYTYNPMTKYADVKSNANEIATRRIMELTGPSTSVFYPGEVKDRIRNITAKVESIRGFNGIYGFTNICTFTSGDYVFVWMTSKCEFDFAAGDTVDLTGTIKKFDEYLGVAQTHLSRCIIKKVGN